MHFFVKYIIPNGMFGQNITTTTLVQGVGSWTGFPFMRCGLAPDNNFCSVFAETVSYATGLNYGVSYFEAHVFKIRNRGRESSTPEYCQTKRYSFQSL